MAIGVFVLVLTRRDGFLLGGMMSLAVKSKTSDLVKCVVIDGGELQSRRHLNVRGKSATLPSITGGLVFTTSCSKELL